MKPGSTVKHVVCQDTLVLFDGPGLQSLSHGAPQRKKSSTKAELRIYTSLTDEIIYVWKEQNLVNKIN